MSEKVRHMVKGALILSIAAFISKVLSAIYRVPFQNFAGDVGFYVYQQVYPLYGIAMILALNGLPVFIAKLLAEESHGAHQQLLQKRLTHLLGVLGIVLFLVCWFLAPFIAKLMGDSALSSVVRQVSWLFLLMPFLAILRGLFQQKMNMTPVAVSQVVEQLVRVAVIIGVAFYAYRTNQLNPYDVGEGAMSGAWIGGLFAVGILLIWYYKKYYVNRKISLNNLSLPHSLSYQHLAKRLIIEGGWLCLFAALLLLFQLVDSFTVKKGLVAFGLTEEAAKIAKGVYDRGQPLVQLGMVVATAFSTVFLPVLSQAFVQKNEKSFRKNTRLYLKMTTIFAVAATTGLILIMPSTNQLLFNDQKSILTLQLFVVTILLASLINGLSSVYQSQQQYRLPGVAFLIGVFVKLVITYPLVEKLGTVGASISTLIGLAVILIICGAKIIGIFWQEVAVKKFCLQLIVSTLVMGVCVWLSQRMLAGLVLLTDRGTAALYALVGILMGVLSFGLISFVTGLLTKKEWQLMKGMKKIKE